MTQDTAREPRWHITSRDGLEHAMTHPIRGHAWAVRELARVTDCPPSTLYDLLNGKCKRVPRSVAIAIGNATVGPYPSTLILFTPAPSKESDTESAA